MSTAQLALALAVALAGFGAGCSERAPTRPPADGSSDLDGSITHDGGSRPDRIVPDGGFVACETTTAFSEPLPATLMFQVDTSGSMNCSATDGSCATGEPTAAPDDSRWDVFRARLGEALVALTDSTAAGLMHYPFTFSCPSTTPDVAIAPLSSSRAPITAALATLVPEGITPTHDAVVNALAVLRSAPAERRFLVLATDGAASSCLGCDAGCSFGELDRDNEALVSAIAAAAGEGIPTFVIGVPGSQSYREILSRMASAAGTARAGCSDSGPVYCHHDLTDPSLDFGTALRDALASIGEAVVSCEYEIPENPDGSFDETRVNVRVIEEDGSEGVIGRDATRANGWDYSDDGERIILHGEACDRAESLRGGRIDVLFGCPTLLI